MASCLACSTTVRGITLYAKPRRAHNVDPYEIYHPICYAIVHESDSLSDQEVLSAIYSIVGMEQSETWA